MDSKFLERSDGDVLWPMLLLSMCASDDVADAATDAANLFGVNFFTNWLFCTGKAADASRVSLWPMLLLSMGGSDDAATGFVCSVSALCHG